MHVQVSHFCHHSRRLRSLPLDRPVVCALCAPSQVGGRLRHERQAENQEYIKDADCRRFSVEAYFFKAHALIPIALPALSISDLEADVLFRKIIKITPLLHWTLIVEEQAAFWVKLKESLKDQCVKFQYLLTLADKTNILLYCPSCGIKIVDHPVPSN